MVPPPLQAAVQVRGLLCVHRGLAMCMFVCVYLWSGGPIAASWAVLRYMGQEGYMEMARKLMGITDVIKRGINDTEVRARCC